MKSVAVMENTAPPSDAAETEKKEMLEAVVAELCSSAPSEDVKNCIRCYEYGSDLKQIKQNIMKCKKAILESTYDFLKRQNDTMPSTKPVIAHSIVCRIQNFLPETCSICSGTCRSERNDTHLLECAVCGQEIHHPCLLQMLQKESVGSLTAEEVKQTLNPLGLNGLHYLCKVCTDATIPKDVMLNKGQAASLHHNTNSLATENHHDNLTNRPQEKEDEPVCKFYNQGVCKHGKRGKKCKFAHPPLCQKLLQHGQNSTRGCKLKKSECKFHHPHMCKASLSRGECFKKDCKNYHSHCSLKILLG